MLRLTDLTGALAWLALIGLFVLGTMAISLQTMTTVATALALYVAITTGLSYRARHKQGRDGTWREWLGSSLLAGFLLAPFLVAAIGFWHALQATAVLVASLPPSPAAAAAGAGAVLAVGALLFFVRLHFRAIFGVGEVFFGVFIAAHRFGTVNRNPNTFDFDFYLVIVTAALFLIVRGLDNVHQGLAKEPKDKLFGFILRLLKQR